MGTVSFFNSAPGALTDPEGGYNHPISLRFFILLYPVCINNIRDLFKKNNYCRILSQSLDLDLAPEEISYSSSKPEKACDIKIIS
jgi:hypothetical protein